MTPPRDVDATRTGHHGFSGALVRSMIAAFVVATATPAQGPGVPARVRAARETQVPTQVSGVVIERPVARGAHVAPGEVVLRIDPSLYRIRQSRADAELTKARALLEHAKSELTRTRALAKKDSVFQAEVDRVTSNELAARAAVQAATVAHEEATWHLERTSIRAPHAGMVTEIHPELGEMVTAGRPVIEVQSVGDLVAESFLTPVQVTRFTKGARVRVEIREPRALSCEGTVTELAGAANRQRLFRLRVAIPKPPAGLLAGFEAQLHVAPPR